MTGKLSPIQAILLRRKSKPAEQDPTDEAGELNIVPFLDIITNILMFLLATMATIFTATIVVPSPERTTTNNRETERLTVQIQQDGYIIGAPGGFLLPGCQAVGNASITIPLHDGQHDHSALTRCLSTARSNPSWSRSLQSQRTINVSANGNVPYHVMIATLDAVRETRPGALDLFPEPALGILQ